MSYWSMMLSTNMATPICAEVKDNVVTKLWGSCGETETSPEGWDALTRNHRAKTTEGTKKSGQRHRERVEMCHVDWGTSRRYIFAGAFVVGCTFACTCLQSEMRWGASYVEEVRVLVGSWCQVAVELGHSQVWNLSGTNGYCGQDQYLKQ